MRGVLRTQFTRFVNAPTKIHVIFLISPISLLEMVSFLYLTCISYMCLVVRKPVFRFTEKFILKQAYSATETS